MTIPQLRVRTEFSFRQAFGPLARVAAALTALECPAAGIVDEGTWGHVRWAKALAKTTTKPLFGREVVLPQEDGRKPVAWCLAQDTRAFYQLSSALEQVDADRLELLRQAAGVIRFAGAALTDPETFDYIDVNPASSLQLRRALDLAKRTGKPLVITSDNAYPAREDYKAFMALIDREKVTPQHLLSRDELWYTLGPTMGKAAFDKALRNTFDVAEKAATALPKAPLISVKGDLAKVVEKGRKSRIKLGHIESWTKEHDARLKREMEMIKFKKYESYFLVVADLIAWAKKRMLVGPGRGSSAGSLLCYLTGITELDPLEHDLLFERFIDVTRNDLPDIDIDFNDQKRDQVFTYLADKYGKQNVARIGNINTYKPKSVLQVVCKKFAVPDHERFNLANVVIEYSSGDSRYGKGLEDALENSEVGRKFIERHPETRIMTVVENHASHTGVHAAGVIVCNEPVSDFCTVGGEGVAQIDKPDSEYLNLLKIDALGLRTLGIIEDSGVVTADQLYALKLDDPAVFDIFNDHKFTGIFQFEGQTQRMVSSEVDIKSFRQIDHVTALARPGPLGGGASQHYIARAAGREEVTYRHPTMANYLANTMGVVLYQEQVMRICREMGQFPWEVVAEIRKAMSASKGKEYFDRRGAEFIAGAKAQGIPEHDAKTVWGEICTFGAWGMNKSHTTAYGVISYWCAWMKCYHPLEFAAACLRAAKDDDQTMAILREMANEGVEYTAFDIDHSDIHWKAVDGRLVGGFQNIHGIGPAKAQKAVSDRKAGRMTQAQREKILAMPVKFSDLYPLRSMYHGLFSDPAAHGCREGSVILTADQFPERGEVLFVARIADIKPRDENETLRIARREGKRMRDPTLFLDITVKDDSGTPIIARVGRFDYEPLGRIAKDALLVGDDLLIRGDRVPGFSMVRIHRVKCLNRPEALREAA